MLGADAATALTPAVVVSSFKQGFDESGHHDQRLRNQSVGSTCTEAVSGARLQRLIWIRMSVGDFLAYSTNTSKYRFSWNTPVSSSSYSRPVRPRRAFVAIRSSYGYAACGYL